VQEVKVEPKAHSTLYSPDGKWLLVPATGPNKIFQFQVDAVTGLATPNNPPYAEGPPGEHEARQPRHLVFHPTLPVVYTTNERLQPGVGMWSWDSATGLLTAKQNLVSLRQENPGSITTADIHLTPNAKFLYISNRDAESTKKPSGSDDIVGYRVNPTDGTLTHIGNFPCGRVPRWFTISSSGKWLYVLGQGDNTLGTFSINAESGALTRVEQILVEGRPGWVTVVNWD
jgi:6-phosphogluconolactonase